MLEVCDIIFQSSVQNGMSKFFGIGAALIKKIMWNGFDSVLSGLLSNRVVRDTL